MSENLRQTPLHSLHTELGARFVPFVGWEMPVQYSGILEEHRAVRQSAGLFDVSHMGEARVRGNDAAAFLNHLITNDVSRMEPGRVLYSPMCNEAGGVIDDLLISQVGESEYFLCLNASNTAVDLEHIRVVAKGFDVEITDESEQWALIALQGPSAENVLKPIAEVDLAELRRFQFKEAGVAGVRCLISRTGYTGEDGFELYVRPNDAVRLWQALLESGKPRGLIPCGLGARDSLRLEAGFPLHGHEISPEISPLEGGIGWTVRFSKASDFIGRTALEVQRDIGPPRRMIFFLLEDRRIARPGATVEAEGKAVGTVVSGTFSPITECPIGSALINSSVNLEAGLSVDLRGKKLSLIPKIPPLHR